MAEDKTQKVYVRLVKGFTEGVTHRRGGVALVAGPTPVEAEVTKDQLDAIKADPNVEIVSGSDAKKISAAVTTLEGSATPSESTSSRNYEGGSQNSPEGRQAALPNGEELDGDSDDSENLNDLKREELNARATEAGVEKPDELPNKKAVIEAIEKAKTEG